MYVCMYILYTCIASEWKLFLLFYVPATLYGVLPMKYYAHVFLLIKAMRILLNEYIDHRSLALADQLLAKFCKLMEQYYGELFLVLWSVLYLGMPQNFVPYDTKFWREKINT